MSSPSREEKSQAGGHEEIDFFGDTPVDTVDDNDHNVEDNENNGVTMKMKIKMKMKVKKKTNMKTKKKTKMNTKMCMWMRRMKMKSTKRIISSIRK